MHAGHTHSQSHSCVAKSKGYLDLIYDHRVGVSVVVGVCPPVWEEDAGWSTISHIYRTQKTSQNYAFLIMVSIDGRWLNFIRTKREWVRFLCARFAIKLWIICEWSADRIVTRNALVSKRKQIFTIIYSRPMQQEKTPKRTFVRNILEYLLWLHSFSTHWCGLFWF